MSTYSVAEAKNRLSELIDRALEGEARSSHDTVTPWSNSSTFANRCDPYLLPIWIGSPRAASEKVATLDAATLVSRMRDEDDE